MQRHGRHGKTMANTNLETNHEHLDSSADIQAVKKEIQSRSLRAIMGKCWGLMTKQEAGREEHGRCRWTVGSTMWYHVRLPFLESNEPHAVLGFQDAQKLLKRALRVAFSAGPLGVLFSF
jgi:hypothetical protein